MKPPAAALFPLLLAACAAAPGPIVTQGSLRYLALGDSYTIGEGVAPEQRWPAQLVARLRAEGLDVAGPEIIARTGWTTAELDTAIDQSPPQGGYDLVSLLIGVNNQFRGLSIDDYRNQFGALLDRSIEFAGGDPSRVIILSIPDWGVTPFGATHDPAQVAGEIDAFNAVALEETTSRGAQFVDITPISRRAADDLTLLAADGLHPSDEMYREWVELVLPIARLILSR
jgi:lysophospholipase L1-like esterase